VILVAYQNAGDTTVYSAQSRITAVDPFSSGDDTAYLGDLKPGESATARYSIGVSDAAVPKEYLLDSEVRYRDALSNSQISDTLKVRVLVTPGSGTVNPFSSPLVLLLAVAGVIGAGYYVLVRRTMK
jgi:hypothetical protein